MYMESWSDTLQPYHCQIFRTLAALIPVENFSLDDGDNRRVIDLFRSRLNAELDKAVKLEAVESSLTAGEADTATFSPTAWMGFFSCVAYIRHAYR